MSLADYGKYLSGTTGVKRGQAGGRSWESDRNEQDSLLLLSCESGRLTTEALRRHSLISKMTREEMLSRRNGAVERA